MRIKSLVKFIEVYMKNGQICKGLFILKQLLNKCQGCIFLICRVKFIVTESKIIQMPEFKITKKD